MAASAKDEKPDAAPPVEGEREKVRRYRRDYGLKLGLTVVEAALFADSPEVSLSRLHHVIIELKCAPPLAAKILL